MTPFTGKLFWIVPIVGGLFIAGSIALHYRGESGLKWLLGFIGAGIIGLHLMMWKHRRDKARREATSDTSPLDNQRRTPRSGL
jgi:hypothetical protein